MSYVLTDDEVAIIDSQGVYPPSIKIGAMLQAIQKQLNVAPVTLVVPFTVVANASTPVTLIPAGVKGKLTSLVYTVGTKPSSAAGTITLTTAPVTATVNLETQNQGAITLPGGEVALTNGLLATVVSNNADAEPGDGTGFVITYLPEA